MKKVVRLNESNLVRLIKRVIKEEASSNDLYTLLHSLRNSINDGDKKKSLSKLEDIFSIVRNMDDKNKSKREFKETEDMMDFDDYQPQYDEDMMDFDDYQPKYDEDMMDFDSRKPRYDRDM